jgi:hypothetical protein
MKPGESPMLGNAFIEPSMRTYYPKPKKLRSKSKRRRVINLRMKPGESPMLGNAFIEPVVEEPPKQGRGWYNPARWILGK